MVLSGGLDMNKIEKRELKIAIFFQQYDIAPYSSGIPVFYLPLF